MDNLPAVVQTAITEQHVDLNKVHLMLPTQTFGDVLGQFDKVTIEVVTIDPNAKNGDVFEIGKGKYSLGKRPLQAISNAVGIVWDPATTTILESTKLKSRAKATGAMRKPNGEMIVVTEEKTVDLEAIEEKLRITQEDYAEKGKLIGWESGQPIKEPWTKHGGEQGKQLHIDREVRTALIQYRLFKDERAMTGAKERVIRAFMAIKSNYSQQELSKPFAFPRVTVDSDKLLAVPEVRQAAIARMTGTVGSIFGPSPQQTLPEGTGLPTTGAAIGADTTFSPVAELSAPAEEADDFNTPVGEEAKKKTNPSPQEMEALAMNMARAAMEEWMQSPIIQGSASAMASIKELLANENATLEELHALNDKCRDYETRKSTGGGA